MSDKVLERLDALLGRRVFEGDERTLAAKEIEEACRQARISERRTVLVESAKDACLYCRETTTGIPPPRDRKAGARWHSVPASNGPAGADWCKAWRIWDRIEELPT